MKLAAGRIGFACFGFAHLCLRRCEAFISPPATALLHRTSSPSISSRSSSSTGPRMMLPLAPFAGAAAAHFIGSIPLNPDHLVSAKSQPTQLVARKEIREGIYGPYEVEVTEKAPETDFGISTFKKKEDTEEGRDKYVSVLAVLLAGSFIIPMVQYWWYVRDDDRPIE